MTKKHKKLKIRILLLYMLPVLLILLSQNLTAMKDLEYRISDRMYQEGARQSRQISVIGIDEDTLAAYGEFSTWSRKLTARLINKLTEDPDSAPAVIAVDIGFFGERDEKYDQELVDAVKKAGNVVLVSTATFGSVNTEKSDGTFAESTQVVQLEEPFDALKEAAAYVGHSNTQPDEDGIVRHAVGSLPFEEQVYDSFAYEIFSLYAQKHPQAGGRNFGNTTQRFYIRYAGKPYAFFGSVGAGSSFRSVLEGEYPVRAFKDGIVLIGAYASGMQDQQYTSIDRSQAMNGVEIHANIVQQLIDGVQITEPSLLQCQLLVLVIGMLILLFLWKVDTRLSVPASLLLAVLYYFGCGWVGEKLRFLLPVTAPILVILLLCIVHIVVRYFVIGREKKKIIASYGKYLSPEIASTIADTGEEMLQLGGQKKDIAVLFVDIRSFTTLSEQLPPEKVVEMLNSYLKITTSAIFQQKGTVDKFIGDATMGVFNAPLDLPDYTYRAVCAGLEMARMASQMTEDLSPELRGRVGFGVGINCGEAIVGNIGTDFRMEYTAIGDTVNTASRLEGQAKAGWVVISEKVYDRVKDRIKCEDLGYVKLKGKADEVHIYRALEIKEN